MWNKLLQLCAIALVMLGAVTAQGALIVDTGPPRDTNLTAYGLDADQWLAGQFTFNNDYIITEIDGHFGGCNITHDITHVLTIAIYKPNQSGVAPDGNRLFSKNIDWNNFGEWYISPITGVPYLPMETGWWGITGLDWKVPAGTYWVAFETERSRIGGGYTMLSPALYPLSHGAMTLNDWWVGPQDDIQIAVKIYGDALVPSAVLSVNATNLSPSCVPGQNAANQNFTVQNTGVGTLSYTISDNATWLSVTPTSGTSTGEQDTITVSYATSGLASGTYTGIITITAPGATGTPKNIGVTLTVNAASTPPVLSVNPTSLSPSCVRGKNAASQNFTVQNIGTVILGYTVTKSAAWLSVTPTSGTSTGEQDTITVNYATSGLAAGTYTGAITVTAPGATGTPKTIGVNLKVKPQFNPSLLLLLLD